MYSFTEDQSLRNWNFYKALDTSVGYIYLVVCCFCKPWIIKYLIFGTLEFRSERTVLSCTLSMCLFTPVSKRANFLHKAQSLSRRDKGDRNASADWLLNLNKDGWVGSELLQVSRIENVRQSGKPCNFTQTNL